MNWLSALKLLPVLTTLGLAVFSYIQTERLSSTQSQLDTVTEDRDAKDKSITEHRTAIAERDEIIRMQTASIEEVELRANANRDAYRAALAKARTQSAKHQDVADTLLSLTGPEGELEQCRAARDLLEQELVQ